MKCRKCGAELAVGGEGETDVELYNARQCVKFTVACDCGDSFETEDFGCFLNQEQRADWLEDFIEEYENEAS